MARSIQEIQTLIYQAKAQEPALNELNSTSKVAIWRLWVYIISVAIWSSLRSQSYKFESNSQRD